MKLTEHQQRELLSKFSLLFGERPCDLCGADEWAVTPYLWELPSKGGASLGLHNIRMPLAAIVCERCGNTKLLSAVTLGLVEAKTGKVVDGKKPFDFTSDVIVNTPDDVSGVVISRQDWSTMMQRIQECTEEAPSDAFAWACIGFAGSSLLAALSFPFAVEFVHKIAGGTEANIVGITVQVLFVVLALCGFVQGAKSLRDRKQIMKTQKKLRDRILEDMNKHQQRFPEPPEIT